MFSINVLLNYKQLGDSPSRTAASTAPCATLANKLLVPTELSVVCKVSRVGLPIDQASSTAESEGMCNFLLFQNRYCLLRGTGHPF